MPPMASTSTSTTARSTATSNACARSSRRLMPSLRKSKRCTASDTVTVTVEAEAPAFAPPAPPQAREQEREGPRRAARRWPISPLTRRILAVNVLALAILAGSFLYLGKYQASLLGQQIESLKMQGEIFAAALGEGAVLDSPDEGEVLLPDLARQMMRRLVEPTHTRARLFDVEGRIIADSRALRSLDGVIRAGAPAPQPHGALLRLFDRLYAWIAARLPHRTRYPVYHASLSPRAEDFAEVVQALHGKEASAVLSDPQKGGLMIRVAVPIQRYGQVLGAVMLL